MVCLFSVVRVPPVTTVALIENGRTFICASQLLSVVADLISAALLAAMRNGTGGLHFVIVEDLHFRPLCTES